MKFNLLLLLLIFVACSSRTEQKSGSEIVDVSEKDFKKENPLKASEVQDFYRGQIAATNPALQDETLDRLSTDEIKKLNTSGDPLLEMTYYCNLGEVDKGLKISSMNFNRYQKVPQYWNLLGNCHLNQGSYRKALLFYNKSLELESEYVPALNNIGVMYARQKQYQKALVAFERANKKSKFSKTPRYNLAKLYLTYGLADAALPLFESLLKQTPGDVGILNAVASSYFLKSDYQSAYKFYQQIPKQEWKRPEIGLNFAFTLKKIGKDKESQMVFQDIEKSKNSEIQQYYHLVKSHLGDSK